MNALVDAISPYATLLVAVGAFVGYFVAYHTYGRWLARRVFQLDKNHVCPSVEVNDGHDYVPSNREVVFGHHFTSIAGTGPIVGPAVAVFWGWAPALIWVLLGSVFIGAVHDFGALVVSLRSRGQTIGDIAARMINPRARVLFLSILFLSLAVVIGIFGLVIAIIFANYPSAVLSVWVEVPIAVAIGWWVYRRGGGLLIPSLIALVIMYGAVAVGAYLLPIDLTRLGLAADGVAAAEAGQSVYANAVVIWTMILLVYCFFASTLPVWALLQPRDYINSHQLLLALGLLFAGLLVAPFTGAGLPFVAPAINATPPADAPPIWPFLFITIACGAVSGFHCLVSSGATSKQLRCESHAQFVGFGAMLLEGGLAVIVILACAAGLGLGAYAYQGPQAGALVGQYVPILDSAGAPLLGRAAWAEYYGAGSWAGMRLPQQIGAFIEGGANLLRAVGLPITLGIGVMAVLVASFAATTLDTATRLQRYVVSELGAAVGIGALRNRYLATSVAVITGGGLAMIAGPRGPGSGGLILWPIFGVMNQMLAGLSFLVVAFYLLRHNRPMWFLIAPAALMMGLTNWAMWLQLQSWFADSKTLLVAMGGLVMALQIWIIIEGLLLWPKVRGVLPTPLPPLDRPRPEVGPGFTQIV
ncbi:MAG: carbon starvation protein A [Phycisphaerales bacterium]|nr:carbon starvation protein A [Phycisphaerales bacterium]